MGPGNIYRWESVKSIGSDNIENIFIDGNLSNLLSYTIYIDGNGKNLMFSTVYIDGHLSNLVLATVLLHLLHPWCERLRS